MSINRFSKLILMTLVLLCLGILAYINLGQISDNGKFIPHAKSNNYNQPEAVELKNGRILIVDACQLISKLDKAYQPDAQIFDPNSKKVTSIDIGREGYYPLKINNNTVLLLGETQNKKMNINTGKLYKASGKLPKIDVIHSAHLLSSGNILIIGSQSNSRAYNVYAWLYDKEKNTYKSKTRLNIGFSLTDFPCVKSVLLANGQIFLTIGSIDSSITIEDLATVNPGKIRAILYSPEQRSVKRLSKLILKRLHGCGDIAKLKNGKVLILSQSKILHLFDPITENLQEFKQRTHYEGHETLTLLSNGKVLFTGGMRNALLDPDWWSPLPPIFCPEHPEGAEIFDPIKQVVSPIDHLNYARTGHKVIDLLNGQALVVGGTNRSDCEFEDYADRFELFIPK